MAELKNTRIINTGAMELPSGTTAQRPVSPNEGYLRHNSTLNCLEYWNDSYWKYVPDIERNNLRLHYDAAEPSSYPGTGTTVYDLNPTTTKYNGTLTNGVSYSTTVGGTFTFDGTDDYINSGTDLSAIGGLFADTSSSSWGASAWFKPDTTNANDAAIIAKSGGVGTSATFVIWTNGTSLYCRLRGGTTFTFPVTLSSSKWYNILVTYNNTGIAYAGINGQFAGEIAIGTAANQTTNFIIGASSSGTLTRFKGSIANVSLYNAFTAFRKYETIFNALKNRFGVYI